MGKRKTEPEQAWDGGALGELHFNPLQHPSARTAWLSGLSGLSFLDGVRGSLLLRRNLQL